MDASRDVQAMPWHAHYPPGVPAQVDPGATPTLVHLLDEAASRFGEREQAVFLGRAFTYARIDAAGRHLAAWLAARGLGPGSRVAVMMPNVPQYLAALAGILRAGAAVVNVNPLYTARELAAQLADAEAGALIVLENFAATAEVALRDRPTVPVLVASIGDWLGPVKGPVANFVLRHVKKAVPPWSIPGALPFDRALAEGTRLPFDPPAIPSESTAMLQYTGGTTGTSKGAMLTHANLVAGTLASEAWLRPALEAREAPTVACALPLYHIYALVACYLLGLRLGARNVLVPNPRDLPALLRDLARHPPTLFPAVNTLYNAILEHPDFGRVDWSRLRVANSGGMAVQRAVAERWAARTGCAIVEGWGLTEATGGVTCNRVDAKDWNGSVGLPLPGCEVRIADPLGRSVPAGEPGEILVRGPLVMAGYWRRPQETANVLDSDGWLRTGDVGTMEESGLVRIVDRKKDMVIVSGFNVYPNEIEDVATGHPGVLEAAAIGVADERTGEAVKLFVVRRDPTLTEADLSAFLRERLTGYKRPKQYVFVESLPKTAVGKILRRALREMR